MTIIMTIIIFNMCFITPLPLSLEWYSKRENSIAFIHKFPMIMLRKSWNTKQTAFLQRVYHL